MKGFNPMKAIRKQYRKAVFKGAKYSNKSMRRRIRKKLK